jgi:hypothetical protein
MAAEVIPLEPMEDGLMLVQKISRISQANGFIRISLINSGVLDATKFSLYFIKLR